MPSRSTPQAPYRQRSPERAEIAKTESSAATETAREKRVKVIGWFLVTRIVHHGSVARRWKCGQMLGGRPRSAEAALKKLSSRPTESNDADGCISAAAVAGVVNSPGS